jgi:hypothetical protein
MSEQRKQTYFCLAHMSEVFLEAFFVQDKKEVALSSGTAGVHLSLLA